MFKRGWKLTVVEREAQVLPRMLDGVASQYVENWLGSRDVNVITQSSVEKIREADNGARVVGLQDGREIEADLVIIATGIRANLDLVAESGIDTDEGILVNDRMQTNFRNIYAGGDVAQGPVLFDEQAAIHAIQPTAVDHGRVAGANMAGHKIHYPGSLLMNVVDVCGLQCASFGRWDDTEAETTTISNPGGFIYRKLLWREDRLVGAMFTGRANDLGMLTDVGMIKGFLQTDTRLGRWKAHLTENPHDIRRAYVASGVANKLAGTTLLGRPTEDRKYHFGKAKPEVDLGTAHNQFVATR
jgi:NAD(P)H-nitrite reductase large subunit